LCLYLTGQSTENKWKGKAAATDLFYMKGVAEALLKNLGISASLVTHDGTLVGSVGKEQVVQISTVPVNSAARFDIKQPVFVADFNWNVLVKLARTKVQFREISRFPAVERDLSMVVAKSLPYQQIHDGVQKLRLKQLKEVKLFDVFESEKLGHDKKSLAVNFTFQDEEKTLTDKEIDNWMHKIMTTLEKDLNAEIRKA
jgi:phenylalanyl-tRNA synthetase beta chain